MGSCFTDHIAQRLRSARFDVTASPFGTVYNPISIKDQCQRLARGREFAEGELIKTNQLWHTWLHHGSYSGSDRAATLARINQDFLAAFGKCQSARCVLLTVGAATVYSRSTDQMLNLEQIVANCHKAPAAQFTKGRLTVEQCSTALVEAVQALRSINPDLMVLLTVSPVKHLRDGMIENLRSKSTLLLACEAATQQLSDVHYLPVYELVTEELRDYRFYASDMCHPSEQAIEYVWDWFKNHCLDTETQEFTHEALRLHAMQQHRALHPDTEDWQRFLRQRDQAEHDFLKRWGS